MLLLLWGRLCGLNSVERSAFCRLIVLVAEHATKIRMNTSQLRRRSQNVRSIERFAEHSRSIVLVSIIERFPMTR